MRLSLKPNFPTLVRILQAAFLITLACITGMVVVQLTRSNGWWGLINGLFIALFALTAVTAMAYRRQS